ncbi:hypothetical protein EK21DRAFT_114210 [Setomelanomma holmii]|uniref:Uncharacterized protein n=1 Tax=Setomelanomma holmii TaxID=210430 RepID=A0A9P4LIH8_9PLEO|nr:hypothetical protein EK21DRAFT_114210 [Setomelanomma holmii]
MGNGKTIEAIGVAECNWRFAAESAVLKISLYGLPSCIFEVILGSDFLYSTETITSKRHRLCLMERLANGPGGRLVNLCGSGAEPSLVTCDYAEQQGWLSDMYQDPDSYQLLQIADGSTAKVHGRLRFHWSYLTGWGPVTSDTDNYHDFGVLRGCPFHVILGCEILDNTETFTNHLDSLHEVVKDGLSGLSFVMWVKAKLNKSAKAKLTTSPVDQEVERKKREREATLEALAKSEWPANTDKWNQNIPQPGVPSIPPDPQSTTSQASRSTTLTSTSASTSSAATPD